MPDSLITGAANYTQLYHFLEAGEWERSDRETGRIVLQIAQHLRSPNSVTQSNTKSSIAYLGEEDWHQFPCEDLHILDRLWTDYSNGHFGFSVQSQIWKEVNGDYSSFAEVVGWSMGDSVSWYAYCDLNFDLSAPEGHLPAAPFYTNLKTTKGLGVGWAASLRWRLDECQTPDFS